MQQEFFRKLQAIVSSPSRLFESVMEGCPPRELLGVDAETMRRWLGVAESLLGEGKIKDAVHLYLFLAALDFYLFDAWIGLGSSAHHLHEYEMALDAYEMASACAPEHPLPYFLMSKVFFAVHERENARSALEQAIAIAGAHGAHKELLQEATRALHVLEGKE